MRVIPSERWWRQRCRSALALAVALMGPLAVLLSGCTGQVGKPPSAQGAGGSGATAGSAGPQGSGGGIGMPTGAGGTSGQPLDCTVPNLQASPIRRLTRREYNTVVNHLLGDTTKPADQFVSETAQSGFLNGADSTPLSPVVVDDFERAATALAKNATAAANLRTLLGCDPNATAGQDACATAFIRSFGARAFRRTLDETQVADYQSLYTTRKPDGFAVAIELVIRAMLQSPYFLYRIEFGEANPGGAAIVKLTPEETASRLSFLFWGSIPDATLTQAAKDGKLSTTADVRAQASRMLMDDKGSAVFMDFHVQWGQLEGLPNLTKPAPFTPDIGRLLIEETKQFVDQTLRKGDGLLTTLFTTPVTYLNQQLATYYGVTGVTGTNFVPVTLPAGQRAGLLTQGSITANFAHGTESSPVLRGKFILAQVACSPPPPPPDNVDTTLPAPDPTKSARQQLIELTGAGICVGCHANLNPPGFALDHFDGLGRYRATDRGMAIDTSAQVVLPTDLKGTYTGHEDFLRGLAQSRTVRTCVSSKWFIYAHGRVPEAADECSLSAAATAFQNDGNIRELLLAITETPAFLYYRTTSQGVAP
jgi:hypothetical protein